MSWLLFSHKVTNLLQQRVFTFHPPTTLTTKPQIIAPYWGPACGRGGSPRWIYIVWGGRDLCPRRRKRLPAFLAVRRPKSDSGYRKWVRVSLPRLARDPGNRLRCSLRLEITVHWLRAGQKYRGTKSHSGKLWNMMRGVAKLRILDTFLFACPWNCPRCSQTVSKTKLSEQPGDWIRLGAQ